MMQQDPPPDTHPRYKTFVRTILTHRRFPCAVALLAVVLTLPSLKVGIIFDDYHHKLLMTRSDSPIRLLHSPLDMFNFFSGTEQDIRKMMDYGFVPWWTFHEGVKAAFWRPLSSMTHWLDYILWPDMPLLMHVHSILWYVALVVAVALLYRRLSPSALIAGLAAILFAIDDAHGTPVGFLSNRNALLTTFFGVLTIIAHDRWRRDNWRAGIVVGPLLLAASLLSAEAGISTCAYLAAHALFIDRANWCRKSLALAPYAAVVVIWRILWTALGYGIRNIGIYIDPLAQPVEFASAFADRAPLLLLGQLTAMPSDIALALRPASVTIIWQAALVFLALLIFVSVPLFRRDPLARFWAVGMGLSVVPLCSTFPNDRLLSFVGVGAMGLVAQVLSTVFARPGPRPRPLCWRIPAVSLAVIFIISHLLIAPPALMYRSANPMGPKALYDRFMIPPQDPSIRNQDLVVVNPPVSFLAMVSALAWEGNNQPMPRRFRVLTSSLFEPVEIRRPDANTLVVRPRYGYYAWALDALFRNKKHRFALADRVELSGMTVEITQLTSDGRPAEAAFRFAVPLEDPSLCWLRHDGVAFLPFTPPPIGSTEILRTKPLF